MSLETGYLDSLLPVSASQLASPVVTEEEEAVVTKANLVQTRNPHTDRYVLIDRSEGRIVESKETPGPYEGVPIARKRTIKDPAQPPDNITIEQARETARAVSRAREIKQRHKNEGRTFSDSTDLLRWDRETVTPEDAADWVVDPSTRQSETATEFAERFIARYPEIFKRLVDS